MHNIIFILRTSYLAQALHRKSRSRILHVNLNPASTNTIERRIPSSDGPTYIVITSALAGFPFRRRRLDLGGTIAVINGLPDHGPRSALEGLVTTIQRINVRESSACHGVQDPFSLQFKLFGRPPTRRR